MSNTVNGVVSVHQAGPHHHHHHHFVTNGFSVPNGDKMLLVGGYGKNHAKPNDEEFHRVASATPHHHHIHHHPPPPPQQSQQQQQSTQSNMTHESALTANSHHTIQHNHPHMEQSPGAGAQYQYHHNHPSTVPYVTHAPSGSGMAVGDNIASFQHQHYPHNYLVSQNEQTPEHHHHHHVHHHQQLQQQQKQQHQHPPTQPTLGSEGLVAEGKVKKSSLKKRSTFEANKDKTLTLANSEDNKSLHTFMGPNASSLSGSIGKRKSAKHVELLNFSLKGGPPWGFRIKQRNGNVFISKVSGVRGTKTKD